MSLKTKKILNPYLENRLNNVDIKKSYNPNVGAIFDDILEPLSENRLNCIDIKKRHYSNYETSLDNEFNKTGSIIEVKTITHSLKITMIGNSYVGKTSIIKRYFDNHFEKDFTSPTVTATFHIKTIKIDPYTFADLKIWDTAGQEKYRSLTKNYINGSNGILIVFDLTDEKSFNDLDLWMKEIKDTIDIKEVKIILVGNKSDLPNKKISNEQALKYAKENNMEYHLVSAKSGINIETLFEKIGNACIKTIQEEQKKLEEMEKADNIKGEKVSALSLEFENNINNEKLIISEKNKKDKNKHKCC